MSPEAEPLRIRKTHILIFAVVAYIEIFSECKENADNGIRCYLQQDEKLCSSRSRIVSGRSKRTII